MCGLSNPQYQRGYPTKSACEAAAFAMKGRQCDNGSGGAWGNKIIIGNESNPCYGKDLPTINSNGDGGFSDKFGNTDITGTNQGDPFHTDNPFETLQDAYDQKIFQNEVLLENGQVTTYNRIATTGDINFDTKFANFTVGRPGSAEGIFNWLKQRRPLSNNDVKNGRPEAKDGFTAGRPGAMGGFNAGPARPSVANRYNGQRFYGELSNTSSIVKSRDNTNVAVGLLGKDNEAAAIIAGNALVGGDKVDPNNGSVSKEQLEWIRDRDKIIKEINQQDTDITTNLTAKYHEINAMPEGTEEQKRAKENRKKKYTEVREQIITFDNGTNKAFKDALKNGNCNAACKSTAARKAKDDGAAALTAIDDI
jgi:hypothetical protein